MSAFNVKAMFARDFERYEGVRPIQIYLMRLGLINPLKWIPLVLFEIAYKSIWLVVVAYPMWSTGQLAGSRAEGIALSFVPVILPILAMPWGYVWRTHMWPNRLSRKPM